MKYFCFVLLLIAPMFVFAQNKEYQHLLNLYHYLHTHPELSFYEKNTARRIATELQQAGFEVTANVGGHGVVGVMKNGKGPTVMVRTDLDALPIVEKTGLPYASKVKTKNHLGKEVGVMHACGHDMHMTVFIGTARQLATTKEKWQGTLVMIGQPAEEKGAGAKAMLKDGLYTRFPRPDYALALHVDSSLAAGKVGYYPGYMLANVDSVDITVFGIGGHGAYPHGAKDPIVIASQIVLALQTIVSREISPLDPAVITVGSFHGGTKHNIIPGRVDLQLTVRSYTDQVRNHLLSAIKRIAIGTAKTAGVPDNKLPIVTLRDEYTPATYNDPKLTLKIAQIFEKTFGKSNVVKMSPVMGGEDFGRYGRETPRTPICMFRLGTVDPKKIASGKRLPTVHSAFYYPQPEPSIKTGVRAMTEVVWNLMVKK